MLTGALRPNGTPVVPIEIAGQVYEAVIDTGFDGQLHLPDVLIPVTNPVHAGYEKYQYADGTINWELIFEVSAVFDGSPRVFKTKFAAASDEIMIGVEALEEYRLEINFVTKTVVLERVSPTP